MKRVKFFIKRYLLPNAIMKAARPYYHGLVALFAHFWFGRPSHRLVVVGVTGTNGKSTTVNLIAKILEQAKFKVGFTSTVNFQIAGQSRLNDMKMTMPSGWLLHKWLKSMADAGCQYAVLEVSSEGLAQNRHRGINFDVAVFTNLTPEHLESHGGFENYQKAKGRLFAALHNHPVTVEKKKINPKLQKTIISNIDDEASAYYASFTASQYLTYGIKNPRAQVKAADIQYLPEGIRFAVELIPFRLQLKGKFDVYNALAAIAVAKTQQVSLEVCRQALEHVPGVPGRMEAIQIQPFIALVDYAPEPYSLKALYDTIQEWPKGRLIHILGSTGGGRDRARRKVLGEMAGRTADVVIVANEDPYDDDPQEIIEEVAAGALTAGKKNEIDLFKITDRRDAIRRALSMAQPGDIVLVTGKGSEQKMAVADGQYIDWDDRQVMREELGRLTNNK